MAIVAAYQFRARFRTHSDPLDAPPKVGLSRQGLLLLRQDADVRSDAAAIAACERHGAFGAVISGYGPLDPALLQLPKNKALLPLVEQATQHGSALSYDPLSAPAEEAPSVVQWGFTPDSRQ